ncbi:flagellar hook capping FlgD N-terminal domain-containing protein [Hydrogenophaga sp.]|uniref:flagellar hook assembly protein FlgD n=1 Tax=Hydrogenophaga sp. TaxID=1904254 RepID=UPI0026384FE4|nr:flagellar hook capping FlgD N-terminal domain-containing protein [Hydrogenophaga sp.]MCW5655629.1 flagellar hook assembly protein FlgD [Hydrogenophaga sp.]
MFITPIDTSTLGSTVGSTTGTGAKNATDPQASQDRFLKLLVAQLNSQDPLNPMDNAQMTTQMAQINTVSGIQELNATLKGMATQFGAMQQLQGTSLIGREALIEGSQLGFAGDVGRGAMNLKTAADQVYVDIMGTNGEIVETLDFGALGAGQHAFNWAGEDVDLSKVAGFRVRASMADQPVTATTYTRLTVSSVAFANGSMNLQLQDGRTLSYDQVKAFM